LIRELDDVATRDCSNVGVADAAGHVLFAPSRSIASVARSRVDAQPNVPLQWSVIEECLNAPMVRDARQGRCTTPPFHMKK
jgi:hypothetical protein